MAISLTELTKSRSLEDDIFKIEQTQLSDVEEKNVLLEEELEFLLREASIEDLVILKTYPSFVGVLVRLYRVSTNTDLRGRILCMLEGCVD